MGMDEISIASAMPRTVASFMIIPISTELAPPCAVAASTPAWVNIAGQASDKVSSCRRCDGNAFGNRRRVEVRPSRHDHRQERDPERAHHLPDHVGQGRGFPYDHPGDGVHPYGRQRHHAQSDSQTANRQDRIEPVVRRIRLQIVQLKCRDPHDCQTYQGNRTDSVFVKQLPADRHHDGHRD